MQSYKVKSTDTKKFTLLNNAQELGYLKYKKWFLFKAELVLANQTTCVITPTGLLGTGAALKKEGEVVLNFKMGWKGQLLIHSKLGGIRQNFIFKPKGFFYRSYILLDEQSQEVLILEPYYKWKKLNYDYDIAVVKEVFTDPAVNQILYLVMIHCANYYRGMMVAAS